MNQLSLLHRGLRSPAPGLSPRRGHGTLRRAAVVRARLSSPEPTPQQQQQQAAGRHAATAPVLLESIEAASENHLRRRQEPDAAASGEDDGGGVRTSCPLPTWALIGGITAGVGVALALSAGAGPALALGPEGPLVEEFWDNMRRYALYAVTVSTGVAYTVLQPIVELLKNPVTALLIVLVIAGSGFLVSQVLNAMVGNSDFIYRYE